MIPFSQLFGYVAIGLGILNIWMISRFIKPYIKTLNDINEKERSVTSNLSGTLSNIRTDITLGLEKRWKPVC